MGAATPLGLAESEIGVGTDPLVLSIREAAALGIDRLRKHVWMDPCAHLKIDIINGEPGPWTHLFDPFNVECNGRDPVDVLCIQMDYDAKCWVRHYGPTSGSDEYTAAKAAYADAKNGKERSL